MKYYLAKFNLSTYTNVNETSSVSQSIEYRLIEASNKQEAKNKLLSHIENNSNSLVSYNVSSIIIHEQI
jgi:hypothetical protein